MENSNSQLFVVSTPESIVGIRVDRILSFTFVPAKSSLNLRYIDDPVEEKFEGAVAENIFRELRYAGRK